MTKVINNLCAASRARVDCLPYGSQSSSQSGYKYIPSSQTTPARARTCEAHAAIRNPEAYFRARHFAVSGRRNAPLRAPSCAANRGAKWGWPKAPSATG